MATLRAVSEAVRVLVVLGREDEVNWLSLRNVPEVHLLAVDQLNTYDVLVSDDVVFTADALSEFLGIEIEVAESASTVDDDSADADEADEDEEGEE
jgi:large subunit ribosomal protein L4